MFLKKHSTPVRLRQGDLLPPSLQLQAIHMRMLQAGEQLRLGEEGVDILVFQRSVQDFERGATFQNTMRLRVSRGPMVSGWKSLFCKGVLYSKKCYFVLPAVLLFDTFILENLSFQTSIEVE